MAIFVLIILALVVVHSIVDAFRMKKERENWMYGYEYIRSGSEWVTAKLAADPTDTEFEVKLNVYDDYFYDRDGYGYLRTELKIKRDDTKSN
jgi:hypothetical protein